MECLSITIHRTVFSSLLHRAFFVSQRGWEKEKKRKCAGHNGKGKGRRKVPAFSLFPSSPSRFLFFDYCYLHWDTQRKPLRRREVFSVHYRYITMTTIHGHQKWSIRASRKWACPAPAPSPLTCQAWFLRSSMDRFLSHHRTQKLKVKLLPPIRSAIIYTSFYYLSLISNDLAQAFRAYNLRKSVIHFKNFKTF